MKMIPFPDDLPERMTSIKPVKPVIPYYKANGNVVIEEWVEHFVDSAGNEAILTKVRFKNPKKSEVNEIVVRVKWTKLFEYLTK